jgi:Ran GTPase-activating protein (RanGAP) involved in mRNA processing and transport
VEGLGVGALPAVTRFTLFNVFLGDAGASALAVALERGALPRLEHLYLRFASIGDAGLVALASALRRRPALETLDLAFNIFGDEGLAAIVAPPPADAPPPQAGALAQLKLLDLADNQITDDGCAHLASMLRSGALPALKYLQLDEIPASGAACIAVYEARPGLG